VPQGALWDGRWRLAGPQVQGATLAALGPEGLKLCPEWRAHGPRAALIVSPALWLGAELIAAPLAGFNPKYRAMLSQGFAEFILSH
jgi:tRNA(Ile)-lysidine synthase